MAFVLDSSAALAWVLPDEEAADADAVAARLENDPALVPVIWPLEVHNALLMASRRARMSEAEVETSLSILSALPIEVDHDSSVQNATRSLTIARELDLTVYDASYLELATRHGIALASMDRRLREACAAAGIPLA